MNSWPTAPYWSWATKLTGQVPPQRTSWGKFSGCTDKRQGREPCPALSCMEDHSSYVCAPFWRDKATVKDSVGSPNIWTRRLITDLVSTMLIMISFLNQKHHHRRLAIFFSFCAFPLNCPFLNTRTNYCLKQSSLVVHLHYTVYAYWNITLLSYQANKLEITV